MALRQLMLAKQIADKEKELEEMRGKDADFETREKELEESINEANTEEDRSLVDDAITKLLRRMMLIMREKANWKPNYQNSVSR